MRMILINPHRIVRFFCLFFTLFIMIPSIWAATIVDGRLISGGYVILKVSPNAVVAFQNQRIFADSEGYVALGFARDLSGEVAVQLDEQGKEQQLTIQIEPRIYQEQFIEGISNRLVNPPESALERIYKETAQVKQAREQVSQRLEWRKDQFLWPVIAPISGVYGSRRFYNGEPRSPHWGVDLAAPVGTPVKAPAGGRVVLAEQDLYFSGGTLIVDHGGGLTSSFLHLSKLNVELGDEVVKGDIIAEVGASGRVTGPHLDWRMNLNGVRIDPQLWIDEPDDKFSSNKK